MKVLVACEESQEVCKAFRALGHEAYSCDIKTRSKTFPGIARAMAEQWGGICPPDGMERLEALKDGKAGRC